MTTQELNQLAINGSETYLRHLRDPANNHGRSEIRVHSIEPGKNGYYALRLSQRLFDPDAITFEYRITKKTYDAQDLKVREYDAENRVLIVKPTDSFPLNLAEINSDDLLVISDLSFLVERAIEFFKNHGHRLQLPSKTPVIGSDVIVGKANEGQQKAIHTVLSSPLSYIWGAPGTGKTRFVLAQVLLQYVKAGKKVAIFAPTNVALEQVVKGVIEVVDTAGIARKKLLRLGNPSRAFADSYPEVCEVAGAEKLLKEVTNQIRVIKRILGVDDLSKAEAAFEKFELRMHKWKQITSNLKGLKPEVRQYQEQVEKLRRKALVIEQEQTDLERSLHQAETKLNSIWNKWFKGPRKKQEERVASVRRDLRSTREQKLIATDDCEKAEVQLRDRTTTLETLEQQHTQTHRALKNWPFEKEALKSICAELDTTSIDDIMSRLKNTLDQMVDESSLADSLKQDYLQFSSNELLEKLKNLQQDALKYGSISTQQRLQSVNIIAATLDGHIHRFADGSLKVDHLFLDEAGYANIVKTLPLFTYNTPLTLLGDHMQLPPVCELNDFHFNQEEFQNTFIWAQSALFTEGLFHQESIQGFQLFRNKSAKPEFITTQREDLNVTHRFGANLSKVLDGMVYRNGFSSAAGIGNTQIRILNVKRESPLVRKQNLAEIDTIRQFLAQNSTKDYAVLAPYNNQIRFLKQRLPKADKEDRIMTIHKSQGREWDTVIISVVETSEKWMMGISQPRTSALNLINTAISRAKKQLIIVCDAEYWIHQDGEFVQALIETRTSI